VLYHTSQQYLAPGDFSLHHADFGKMLFFANGVEEELVVIVRDV
jgi:hypothetical protein